MEHYLLRMPDAIEQQSIRYMDTNAIRYWGCGECLVKYVCHPFAHVFRES